MTLCFPSANNASRRYQSLVYVFSASRLLADVLQVCPRSLRLFWSFIIPVYLDDSSKILLTLNLWCEVSPDAGWQENADKPCDTGSPLEIIKKEFPQYDFSSVDPSYPDKTTDLNNNLYAFTRNAILARGQTCLKQLYSRPEKVIAVVSHSGFLRTAVCNRMFFNADWRVFTFDEEAMQKNPGNFILKESKETETKGGGMGRSDVGYFGIREGDFPDIEEQQAKQEDQVEELDEASKQTPSS